MFTFVAASRGRLYDSIAFLLILTSDRPDVKINKKA